MLETSGRASDIDSVDIRDTTASALVQDLHASYSPELRKLMELDEALSPIAADVAHLQDELARLRGQGEEVERLLDERQAKLVESELERSQLAEECARSQGERTEARASLAKAAKQLEGLRTQVAALEHSLYQREAELAESERARTQLADERARAEERHAETQAALADTKKQLDGRVAQVATLDRELGSLRLRLSELETLQAATTDEKPEPEPATHLRLAPQPSGYALSESAERPPRVGELVEVNGRRFCVARVGRSPLPDDARACAFLLPELEQGPPPPTASESLQGPGVKTAASHADKHESHAGGEQHAEPRDSNDARREARNSL